MQKRVPGKGGVDKFKLAKCMSSEQHQQLLLPTIACITALSLCAIPDVALTLLGLACMRFACTSTQHLPVLC